ncbi:SDR family NAD(P)-dependent oxidoreductase [Pseudomonas sp. BP8]|uniref:SDR family NAD(P)-dependent oxidoreductase n=1 Tax=Pseudomonas sp. BP8 TaxID=2817864 RepID=UPI001AE7CA67|nr:SDR family NAD(P)-dependent oxidoreductase [Pseudomonas sp. BP8]MBP2261954.1 NAD(P)-dependent dehydrogenase (short-subunit alcohol dehydrogenase family) [Pseudomonas sp. BP8]HDS1736531.1 SDR family oxidoreductase [Pseudomonas putida]
MNRFENKVAIVTGAAGGIGSAVAARLASEGATVVVSDVNQEAAQAVAASICANGDKGLAVAADIASGDDCRGLVQTVVNQLGRIDILVNNAGINRRGALLDLSEDDWHSSFAVNLDSMYYLCRAVLPIMIETGAGAIVNTASQWGLYPAPGHIAYNVTKAAVASFTQNLARDYAPQNIRVNAVCPGEIHTPMLEAGVLRSGRTIADLDRKVPLGRIGKPEEVAALVAFLASDEAAFMCGSLVEITGAQAVA